MKTRSLTLVLGSVWLISACGARTSEDELLGYQGPRRSSTGGEGGDSSTGGSSSADGGSGAAVSAGGSIVVPPQSGGTAPVNTGGAVAAGGQPASGGAGAGGGFPGNLCCVNHPEPGCNVPLVEECVCNIDDYCCDDSWDERCVRTATNACFGACTPPASGGAGSGGAGAGTASGGTGSGGAPAQNCCSEHNSPGCQNTDISSCVCSFDKYCCNNSWDSYCVRGAELYCKADCVDPGTGGTTSTGGSSSFCELAGDCGSCTCGSCGAEMEACDGDPGCLSIAWCVQATGCLPLGCFAEDTCGDIINDAGGLSGTSTQLALELSVCVLDAGCPCQ